MLDFKDEAEELSAARITIGELVKAIEVESDQEKKQLLLERLINYIENNDTVVAIAKNTLRLAKIMLGEMTKTQ